MDRPISTRTHAVIDYAWATTAGALPKMMNGATSTARLVRNASAAAAFNSMVTRYEAGVVQVMPMKAHLGIDFIMCAALVIAPFFLPRSERRYAATPVALGAIGLLTSLLTETKSPQEGDEAFRPSYEL